MRTGWRGQNENQIEGEEKWQACWCCRDQQRACGMAQASAENLEQTGNAEKETVASVPQREQLASIPGCPCQKEKVQSGQSRVPDHEGGECKGEREPHLGKKERINAVA